MWNYIKRNSNFYRIHLLLFIITPLIFATIFWASNGEYKIHFIDALFINVSAATGTGLSTIDLSSLTPWQQTLIVIIELIGNQVFVSWIVVFIRRLYYRRRLQHIVEAEARRSMNRRDTMMSSEAPLPLRRIREAILRKRFTPLHRHNAVYQEPNSKPKTNRVTPLRLNTDLIRRVDAAPTRINPTGYQSFDRSPITPTYPFHTLNIQESNVPARHLTPPPASDEAQFGGFPGPQQLVTWLIRRAFPSLHRNLRRTITMPRTETLIPNHTVHDDDPAGDIKHVPYLSFQAVVGRNSAFHTLNEEQIAELGGVEYRALNALMWIVPLYYFGLMALAAFIITPYVCLPKWRSNFLPPQQHKKISPIWYSVFQVVGAWANTGMSLVDQNMAPFKNAYLLIVILILLVLAGNTCFPIFIRFTIWSFSKLLPHHSRTRESLVFLLHHPRRCFISMFPARQTWLLLGIVLVMNFVLFAGDLILNLGNPNVDTIPMGIRVILALLQAAAVRSAGFTSITISSMAPASQVLYIIMMYIAIYPIAMSVRSTNVYEERSLGIYHEQDDAEEREREFEMGGNRIAIWGKYLLRHARRQLSFDMWWLALSLFLLCIVERSELMNPANATWFNIFALIFEVVSAYGTVGLSLGTPYANYSFSGTLHTLSKLIICAVMLRGRHRGLPVALDRAVMLPHEFRKRPEEKEKVEEDPHINLMNPGPNTATSTAVNTNNGNQAGGNISSSSTTAHGSLPPNSKSSVFGEDEEDRGEGSSSNEHGNGHVEEISRVSVNV
ncbi:cation transport protein-domain-containing protein [Abortiporus biennis]|nr:cation transport protein-domain-containing protein [Abortiporus biennis]